ncbi:hypothetical protein HW555_008897 [Spodoptera exigua]|uniref:Uncharacterized protein n=1 Tax=Spodoptera exigua TaxID=7107 RepID=A0A835L422_SPOEX|nr:hypothetical protein HW555_008897 [Spodoptera exigua]
MNRFTLKTTMQVCPNITQTMENDLSPCTTGTVSAPTDWSKICSTLAFMENERSSSDQMPVMTTRWTNGVTKIKKEDSNIFNTISDSDVVKPVQVELEVGASAAVGDIGRHIGSALSVSMHVAGYLYIVNGRCDEEDSN